MLKIETKRLLISEASTKDSGFFLELMNGHNWIEYIGDTGISSEDLAAEHIQNNLINSYRENGYGLYKVSLKESDLPIGICGFVKRDYLDHPDIGFALLSKFTGNGFALEAAKAVLNYGEKRLGFEKVLGITTLQNIGSRRLLEKIGFKEIGTVVPTEGGKQFLLFSNE